MKVADMHKIEPLADVYEFDPSKKYVIFVPRDIDIEAFVRSGRGSGIWAQIIPVEDPKNITIRGDEETL